jgi:hypothetical protein
MNKLCTLSNVVLLKKIWGAILNIVCIVPSVAKILLLLFFVCVWKENGIFVHCCLVLLIFVQILTW